MHCCSRIILIYLSPTKPRLRLKMWIFLLLFIKQLSTLRINCYPDSVFSLQWRHNERDDVSNHRRLDCLFNRLFRRRWKKTSKLPVTGLCEGNSPVTGEFPVHRASNAEMFTFHYVIMCPSTYLPNIQAPWILKDWHRGREISHRCSTFWNHEQHIPKCIAIVYVLVIPKYHCQQRKWRHWKHVDYIYW